MIRRRWRKLAAAFLLGAAAMGPPAYLLVRDHWPSAIPPERPDKRRSVVSPCGDRSPGGTGGVVLKVTNLDPAGPGSFREAVEREGPRVVVFEAGGVIDLGMDEIRIRHGRLTVAGETAPSPGITLIRGSLLVEAADVVVRHIRVRPGDGGDRTYAGWEPDGISVNGPWARNVLIEHCSVSWAVDENLSVSGPREPGGGAAGVTIRRSIAAEGLNRSTHAKGPHSKGTLIHDFAREIALVENLYISNAERNPHVKPNALVYFANNLVHNPGRHAAYCAYVPAEYTGVLEGRMQPGEMTALANVFRRGPSTPDGTLFFAGWGKLYAEGNRALDRAGNPVEDRDGRWLRRVAPPPLLLAGHEPLPAAAAAGRILRLAGARPADRDDVDRRLVEECRTGGGRIIDSQDEVGGYPRPAMAYRPLLVPEDEAEREAFFRRHLMAVGAAED